MCSERCHREWSRESTKKQEMLWSLVENAGADLSIGEKEMFYHLLLSYADVMASSTTDLERTDKLQHCIHTGDAPPIRQPVRHIPPHRRKEVRMLFREMLEKEVVEPSTSPWASPIVLVRKKDSSTTFCVDHRKVKDVTRKDAHPLPRMPFSIRLLDPSGSAHWIS